MLQVISLLQTSYFHFSLREYFLDNYSIGTFPLTNNNYRYHVLITGLKSKFAINSNSVLPQITIICDIL